MNGKYLAASVALLAATAAYAHTDAPATAAPATEPTREQVRAELARARAEGLVPLSEGQYLPPQIRTPATEPAHADAPAQGQPPAGRAHDKSGQAADRQKAGVAK